MSTSQNTRTISRTQPNDEIQPTTTTEEDQRPEPQGDDRNDESQDTTTMEQIQELQRVINSFVARTETSANTTSQTEAPATGNRKRKAAELMHPAPVNGLPKVPKKLNAGPKTDHKQERTQTTQGDAELNSLLSNLPEDTLTTAEKQQLEVGARMRELVNICQTLLEGISSHVDAFLEAAPEHLPQSDVNLIEHLTTLDTHLKEAFDLTKQNFAAIAKKICEDLYKKMGLEPEAQRLMNLLALANTLDPHNKVNVDNLKSVKQLNDTARTLLASNSTTSTNHNTRARNPPNNFAMLTPHMFGGYAHSGGMAPVMFSPRGGGSAGAQWYGPGGPTMSMMGGNSPWRSGLAPDQCRRCGMRGHFAAHCPTRSQGTAQQNPGAGGAPRIQIMPW